MKGGENLGFVENGSNVGSEGGLRFLLDEVEGRLHEY